MSLVFHKILVPTDFSETADTALYYGKQLAQQCEAELHLVHVVEDPMLLAGSPALGPGPIPEAHDDTATRERLEQLLTPDDRKRLKTEVHVISGNPGSVIPRYALDGEFELIVMGTHGRGPFSHMLMGSVAEKVVRSAPCPVLTIRHPTHRKAMSERLAQTSGTP